MVLLFAEREAVTVRSEPSVLLDKIGFAETKKLGDGCDFLMLDANVARPLAARGAALALIENTRFEIDCVVSRTAMILGGPANHGNWL